MAKITVMIKNKKPIVIEGLDLDNNTINDILSKVREKEPNLIVNLITISGEDISDFSKKCKDVGLEDEDNFLISDYYNGGHKYYTKIKNI